MQGRISGKWVMLIVRRVNGPDGTFLGLEAGLIDTQHLEDFYRTISMVPGETVTLLHRDGTVIAAHPGVEERRGKRMPAQSPWYARVSEGGGTYRSPGYLGATPSIITVHPLRDYPLVVDSNVSEEAALKAWHGQTVGIAVAVI